MKDKATKVASVVALLLAGLGLVVSGVGASPSAKAQLPQLWACSATTSLNYADFIVAKQDFKSPVGNKAADNAVDTFGLALSSAGPPFSKYVGQMDSAIRKANPIGPMNAVFAKVAKTCRFYGVSIIILPLPTS
jgi:hypothetical protein